MNAGPAPRRLGNTQARKNALDEIQERRSADWCTAIGVKCLHMRAQKVAFGKVAPVKYSRSAAILSKLIFTFPDSQGAQNAMKATLRQGDSHNRTLFIVNLKSFAQIDLGCPM
jgi:hypothetical protein